MTGTSKRVVMVGMSTCNIAAGADEVYDLCSGGFGREDVELKKMGCFGMCYSEPQVQIVEPDGSRFFYANVTRKKMQKIIEQHIHGNAPGWSISIRAR